MVRKREQKFRKLTTLIELQRGSRWPLPPRIARLYGSFRMPKPRTGFHVFSNFVSSLDGIVSLQNKGHDGGGDISGFNAEDRMVMGLLRVAADIIVAGAGTLAADPKQLWTAQAICPELGKDYRELAQAIGKPQSTLNVVVSASGETDLRLPVFTSGETRVMIMTSAEGAKRLNKQKIPSPVAIRTLRLVAGEISAAAILKELARTERGKRVLVEGGPRLLASFYKERLLNEQFLTVAPQIAGRVAGDSRLGLVMGKTFAPKDPLWGTLRDARLGSDLLFLRYAFSTPT